MCDLRTTIHSGNETFYLLNSKGANATNGFGLLHVKIGEISGPILFKDYYPGCLPNYICQQLGYKLAVGFFPNLNTGNANVTFEFNNVFCSVAEDGTVHSTFEIKPTKESVFKISLPPTSYLFCGPYVDTCPIVERNNFLKRLCTEDFGFTVFKCPYSDTMYVSKPASFVTTFSAICDNDPHFYQYCGIKPSQTLTNGPVFCNEYVCETEDDIALFYGDDTPAISASSKTICNIIKTQSDEYGLNAQSCDNLDLPEEFCAAGTETEIVELKGGLKIAYSAVCDGRCDFHYGCEDEAFCGGYLYGMYCIGWDQLTYYVNPNDVCNGYQFCPNNEDERNCPDLDSLNRQDKCLKYSYPSSKRPSLLIVPILNNTRCVAPFGHDSDTYLDPICANFLDQTNCTDTNRSSVVCDIGGYPSTVSKYFVCHRLGRVPALCDNRIDQACERVSLTCALHKHQLCDEIEDCLDGSDEKLAICSSKTERACDRAYKHDHELEIPLSWLRDGVEDCLDGIDEEDEWLTCGIGATKRYVVSADQPCEEVFLCKHDQIAFVEFKNLCDGIDTCGRERRICEESHRISRTFDSAMTVKKAAGVEKVLLYCLPGLDRLQEAANHCVISEVNLSGLNVFGVREFVTLVHPDTTINCDYTFGEIYLILSCAGLCEDSICPLKNKIQYDSCHQQYPHRVYTVTNNTFLSFVIKSGNEYKNDFFRCDNNVCLNYDKVCNVVDDCGDGSDEKLCTNLFVCESKEELIPITEKCDGTIDCFDYSDECNSECGKEIIQNTFLKLLCWCLALLAIILNLISLYSTSTDFKKEMSKAALNNKLLILLINVGDLLTGVFLMHIAVMDTIIYGSGYCSQQLNWLSSVHCSIIGIVSTVGYEISLLSMTILGLVRIMGIRNGTKIRDSATSSDIGNIIFIATFIVLMSITIAVVPLVPQFEDFFVNGMTYEPSTRLFIGAPGKQIHLSIIQEYYGKIKDKNLKWRVINDLVDGMFSSDYGGDALGRKKLEFYGNEGVCLFKFFVKSDDPQRFYSWAVLGMNMTCFAIISLCYIFINIDTRATSKVLTIRKMEGHGIRKRNKRLQRKISLIIASDFLCWLPVTIASFLHSGGVIDATPYYSLISIVFLPINSVINPLFYNDLVNVLIRRFYGKVARFFSRKGIHPEENPNIVNAQFNGRNIN